MPSLYTCKDLLQVQKAFYLSIVTIDNDFCEFSPYRRLLLELAVDPLYDLQYLSSLCELVLGQTMAWKLYC